MAQTQGIKVSKDTIHRAILKLEYRYRRPKHDLSHRQDAEAVASARDVLDWLKNCSRGAAGLQLVFADECEVHAHPYLAKVWQKKGCPMKVMAAGDDHKFMVYGGVEYQTRNIISYQSECKDSEEFIHWLKALIRALPEKPVVVILDNVKYHKSKKCWEWWKKHADRIRPFFLPAYAPHLNLMERIWRFLKSKLSCHRW